MYLDLQSQNSKSPLWWRYLVATGKCGKGAGVERIHLQHQAEEAEHGLRL